MKLITYIIKTIMISGLMIILSVTSAKSQNYPTNYFSSPLDIPLILSGSFGELRGNHFHTGLDLKTQNIIGKNVYAAADGYVSRIKVSPYGYGNALYITHPNGYTTIYGHLDKYNKEIQQLVRKTQYTKKSFEIEIFPKANSIIVKKGDLIAFSGNSGGSGAPHLHFEIRDTRSEDPINPLFFGYQIADTIAPTICKLRIYNMINNQVVNYNEYLTTQTDTIVKLQKTEIIQAPTDTIFPAISGFDAFNGANNKNGFYELNFYFDSSMFYQFIADKLDFSKQRYINSCIDYEELIKNNNVFQRSFVEPNNNSNNLRNIKNNGLIILKDTLIHKIKIVATDYAGQKSVLEFNIQKIKQKIKPKTENLIYYWNKENVYKTDSLILKIPKNAFYSNQYFYANTLKNKYSNYSNLFEIYKNTVPLQSYCDLKIKPNNLTEQLKNKGCIVSIDTNGDETYEGGKYINGYFQTKIINFGNYFIDIDTIAPIIKPIDISNNKIIPKTQSKISFIVKDNLSGIANYKATIDGKWALLKYDPKNNLLYYDIDWLFSKGKHIFTITVSDKKDNVSEQKYNLTLK